MSKTIDEIASDLGVSVTTVKLVINGKARKYRIAKKTQSRIECYIAEHGCRVNQAARSLRLKKSETLGLVLPNLSNPYFIQMAEHLGDLCQGHGYQLITVSSKSDPAREKELTDVLLGRGVDGMFIVSTTSERQKLIQTEVKKKPLVFLDRDFGENSFPSVTSDNFKGSFMMINKLLEVCKEDIYFLYGDPDLPSIHQRVQGFWEAYRNHDRAPSFLWGFDVPLNTKEYGYLAMEKLHQQIGEHLPAALVFSSLPILEGALLYLREKHTRIPSQIIFATFDDHSMLGFLPNKILCIKQNSEKVAEHALQMMMAQLSGHYDYKNMQNEVIQPDLICRNWDY
ncbi:substrate-binding domain-containing protein [Vibrio salinus]|uniref:substrate-binding domain-containing protein n=1 Tax=Vibrio salinus TaxID=2899784 RepID=UPI001E61883D|nr:substrate-binding domain-containing protein [Vibrio salinus]MCE0495638.1 substrate-binding domain-containing protein [Vibrio salinus]